MSRPRDREDEVGLLTAAEDVGPFPESRTGAWAAGAFCRLEAHGPDVRPRELLELLHEVREELEDVGGWSALAGQHPEAVPAEARPVLLEVCALACGAHRLLEALITRETARRRP